jgi:hypothetical protein
MPQGRDALSARFTRAWSANADVPTIAIYFKPVRLRSSNAVNHHDKSQPLREKGGF